jgi:propionate CoA-transferase
VFRLTEAGVTLTEVAPGIDVRKDVLARMQFAPHMPREPAVMAASYFNA